MSGLVKSIGKSFKKLGNNKFVKGLAIAAAVYFVGGVAAGAFGSETAANMPGISGAADLVGLGDTGAFGATSPPTDLGINGGLDPETVALNQPEGIIASAQATPQVDTAIPQAPQVPTAQAPQAPATQPPQAPASTPAPAVQPPSSQAPAPVSEAARGSLSLTGGKSGGVINDAAGWFSKLSPAAQQTLAGTVAGGASALMAALAQKNAMEAEREKEERLREDKRRRGSIQAFGPGAFTPKSGIIDGARG